MICNIELRKYMFSPGRDDFPPEKWQALRELFPDHIPEDQKQYYAIPEKILVDLQAVGPKLHALDIPYDIVEFSPNHTVVKMEGYYRHLQETHGDLARAVVDGALVHVHLPNMGLLLINEVEVLTDCCTDDLQDYLNKGWRILAVCPPNAQRRPDYVLGRTK